MKKIILIIAGICSVLNIYAQSPLNVVISPGTYVVLSSTVQATMTNNTGTPAFVNDGTYTDNTGSFNDLAGLSFSGGGTTSLYDLMVNLSGGSTIFNSLVSVYNTATLAAGSMDANNNLYIRSDAGDATLVNNGLLTDNVRGVIAKASVSTGGCPSFTSDLTLDISGTEMLYQWQSSPDSTTWSDVTGATAAAYTATVTATTYYRCVLSTVNSSFSEVTPGVKTALGGLPDAGTITGATAVCAGASIALTDAISGGTWSSDAPAVASVDASGIVMGIVQGAATISYAVTNACGTAYAMTTVTVNASPGPINGITSECNGMSLSLSDAAIGGVWNESGGHVILAGISDGVISVTGASAGTDTIYYTIFPGCTSSVMVTIDPTPNAISGSGSVCEGSSISVSDGTLGGVWSSGSSDVATISSTGVVTGITAGTSVISYTAGSYACYTTSVITVNLTPAIPVGAATLCNGSPFSVSDATTGGVWNESGGYVIFTGGSDGVANLTATGIGVDTIYYTLFPGCRSSITLTVNPLPDAGTITGTAVICTGASASLTDAAAGGVWSSSSNASVDGSGNVTGLAAGPATISYTVTNSCGTVSATSIVTINATVTGTISGASDVSIGANITLTDAIGGGSWSASNGNATVSAGIVHGVTAGTVTISYTVTGICGDAAATKLLSVGTVGTVGAITGYYFYLCAGATAPFFDGTAGGAWSIDPADAGVASVSATGVVSGISAGTARLSYTLGITSASATVTVYPVPAAISGASMLCRESTSSLSDLTPGGSWTSSAVTVASISTAGTVTSAAAGTTTIYYTTPTAGCKTSMVLTVAATPSLIGGAVAVCPGSDISLSDLIAGGTWSSTADVSVVSTGTATAVATGITTGTATITYTLGSCYKTKTIAVNVAPAAISGNTTVCIGAATFLSDATTGGISWTSSNTSVATVTASGAVTAVAPGATNITYRLGTGCTTTTTVSVLAAPSAITANAPLCTGGSETLSDATALGAWSSSNTLVATIGSGSGTVSSVAPGTAIITYSITGAGCYVTTVVTINATPNAGVISGATALCAGATATLTDAAMGGAWSSTLPAVANVNTYGVVHGIAQGTATISYTVTNVCGSDVATTVVTVNPLPVAGAITGPGVVCAGSAISLIDLIAGGVWSSGAPAVATAGTDGTVTGLAAGTARISYTVTNACGSTYATSVVSVSAFSAGTISGASAVTTGLNITLSDAIAGGVWSATNTNATVSAGGLVSGIAPGTVTISYTITNGCGTIAATKVVTVNASGVADISGTASVCVGLTTALTDVTTGGVWHSANTFVATVGTSGIVTGIAAGTAVISYSVGGVPATVVVTVNANPSGIGGATSVCTGSSVTMSDFTAGGIWTSTGGVSVTNGTTLTTVTGIIAGLNTVSYTLASGCYRTFNIAVNNVPGAISGNFSVCTGAVSHLSDPTTGGISWTSSTPAIATINASGNVTGVSAGTSAITYTISSGCKATTTVTVHSCPSPHGHGETSVSGTITVFTGDVLSVNDEAMLGAWSSSNTDVAIVDNMGSVTGIAPGNANVTHTVTDDNGEASTSVTPVVVSAVPMDLSVVPNPNKGTFTVTGIMGTTQDVGVAFQIIDVLGQVIYSARGVALGGKVSETISLNSALANGIYMLDVRSGNDHKVFHFVIEK